MHFDEINWKSVFVPCLTLTLTQGQHWFIEAVEKSFRLAGAFSEEEKMCLFKKYF